jgi:N-acetylmuramoyl-L-alanine amidase
MTRDGDVRVSLDERVAIANRNAANIFVSIHTNAAISPEAHGTETYFSSRGAPYGDRLAHNIQSRVVAIIGSRNRGVKDRAFHVLTHTTMPAALHESEFISNPDREALLRTDSFRDQIAQGIFEGIVNFLNQYGSVAGASSPELNPANFTFRAAYNDQRTPSSLSPGQRVSFPFAVRNLSNFTWSSSPPHQVNLSYHIFDSRGRMVTALDGLRSPLPRNVAPGEVVDLTVTIQAPTTPGTYTIAFDMVHEGVSWFSQRGAGMEKSTFGVGEAAPAGLTGAVTNDTSLRGVSQVTEQQLVDLFRKRGFTAQVARAQELAPLYIKWGREFSIRADIAWAQMVHETGFLTFGGIVPPDANNFAGIGATGAKNPDGTYMFNRFATPELGVIAHYARLAWYVYPDHVNEYCSPQFDPRRAILGNRHGYRGHNLGTLNRRWAPSPTYTDKIIEFANMIGG